MNGFQEFLRVMEESVDRNGERPLTNKWLRNVLRIVNHNTTKETHKDCGGYHWTDTND